jgi:hypothetical protein
VEVLAATQEAPILSNGLYIKAELPRHLQFALYQGAALMLLGVRLGDPAKAGNAVEQIERAFVTMRDGGNAPGPVGK